MGTEKANQERLKAEAIAEAEKQKSIQKDLEAQNNRIALEKYQLALQQKEKERIRKEEKEKEKREEESKEKEESEKKRRKKNNDDIRKFRKKQNIASFLTLIDRFSNDLEFLQKTLEAIDEELLINKYAEFRR